MSGKFNADAAAELYYNGTKKLETTSLGVSSDYYTGGDNAQLRLGNSGDLQIYHDGSHSYLKDAGTGQLRIQSNTISVENAAGNENIILASENGPVELYHDNSKKLETTSGGATVTGTLTSTALTVNGATSPTTFNHTGGVAVRMTRSSKNLDFNANYAAADTHAMIDVSAGMELRFAVAGTDRVKMDSTGNWVPATNNARDLGSTSLRWRNIYTNDLHLSNEGHSNEVDGTWGNWTIQEGESDLFLKNNRSGKKYKFNLTEVS